MRLQIVTLSFALTLALLRADPIPHTDHSKLYILSRLAFNYLDLSGDSRLSEREMDALQYFPVNGLALRSMPDVKRMREAMDHNKNGLVDEEEFIKFDRWLPVFVNGGRGGGGSVRVRDLQQYAKSGQEPPAYAQLDRNHDGSIDQKELTTAS